MIFFDTDCISAFLWVKKEDLLVGSNVGQLVLPQEVFLELSNPSIPHLGQRTRKLLNDGHMHIMKIMTSTEAASLFHQMVYSPIDGLRPI